jgi:hypothetical protein
MSYRVVLCLSRESPKGLGFALGVNHKKSTYQHAYVETFFESVSANVILLKVPTYLVHLLYMLLCVI